jgi:surface polysaccharide O-acyltransferase-like enzyme
MQKARDDKYSLLKGMFIYFVICTHTMISLGYAEGGEYSSIAMALLDRSVGFGVPFFLLLSGFFISKKFKGTLNFDNVTFKFFLKATILKRVLIPYYIFTTAYMLKRAVLGQKITYSNYFLLESQAHGLYYLVVFIYGLFFFFWLDGHCIIFSRLIPENH